MTLPIPSNDTRSSGLSAAGPRSRRAGRWSLVTFLAGLVGALLLYRDLWTDPLRTTLGSSDHINDPMQMMWFLKWVPWQLLHGRSPFVTDALFYPGGVSLSWNTLVPTLGVIAAPLTLASPALSFAVLMTVAPALTALTGFWWLRRHVGRFWPAAVGGLLVAFNPFMSGQLLGHLNLVFTCLLPVMVMLAEDLLWRRPRPQRRTAAYLGIVTALQTGISEELVLILVMAVAAALVFSLALRPAPTWKAIRDASGWAALSVAVMIVVASPLLISQLLLSPTVVVDATRFRADPSDFVHASVRQAFGLGTVTTTSPLGGAEHGVYLGWPVVAVLVVGLVITCRQDPWMRVAAGSAVVLVGLCMFPLLATIPAVQSVLPARYSFALYFVIAWMFARWFDHCQVGRLTDFRSLRPLALCASAAMIGALVSLAPAQVGSYPLPEPTAFFGSTWQRDHLPGGTAVLFLPAGDARVMYDQQRADFSFLQPGGYALLPPGSSANSGPAKLLIQLSDQVKYGPVTDVMQLASARLALGSLSLRAVVVSHGVVEAAGLMDLATDLMQRPPDYDNDGVSVWLL